MSYPAFYDEVQPILLHDPLSDFLGAFEEGIVEIRYMDCVKLAGHSCPTVAGAYLMALIGLKVLYGSELPQRGQVHVSLKDKKTAGVTGVIGNVISFITGAGGEEDFNGIQGNFARNHLLNYEQQMMGEVTLRRIDNDTSVTLSYDSSIIPGDQRIKSLLGKLLQQDASDQEIKLFKTLWQERVKEILLSNALWDKMITLH